MAVPKFDDLMDPCIRSLRELGGSASVNELEENVASHLSLSKPDLEAVHRGTVSQFSYRLAWARNYLKRAGLIENSSRGVWSLTPEGTQKKSIDKTAIKRVVRTLARPTANATEVAAQNDEGAEEPSWQVDLLSLLLKMPPPAFERLCQRVLRESGFTHVEVTGRSGDGGIDGKGVVKLGGLLSFPVVFQCKRYKGSISPSIVREFRGSMLGRAEKGLLMTTGGFSREARTEAQRVGVPPIDLVDGDELMEMLKKLRLGVEVRQETRESVLIQASWFQSI